MPNPGETEDFNQITENKKKRQCPHTQSMMKVGISINEVEIRENMLNPWRHELLVRKEIFVIYIPSMPCQMIKQELHHIQLHLVPEDAVL